MTITQLRLPQGYARLAWYVAFIVTIELILMLVHWWG